MKTRITDLFGIQYPIIQGAMQWLSKPKLAAAVSNAGGLGTINMTTYDTPEAFQQDIQLLKTLTDKPFCVNLSLLPDTKPDGPIKGFLQAITEEKVRIVETAGSSQAVYGHLEGGRLPGHAQDSRLPFRPHRPGGGLRRGVYRGV